MTVETNLPIATKTVVTVVIAAAAIAAVIDPEHTSHRAHGAADTGADRTANHATHGTGNPVTFARAFLGAADDALRVGELRDRQQGERDGRDRK